MTPKQLTVIAEIFKNCTFEITFSELCIFDKKKRFVGRFSNIGVSMNTKYQHFEKIKEILEENNIQFWDDEVSEEIKMQQVLDEV